MWLSKSIWGNCLRVHIRLSTLVKIKSQCPSLSINSFAIPLTQFAFTFRTISDISIFNELLNFTNIARKPKREWIPVTQSIHHYIDDINWHFNLIHSIIFTSYLFRHRRASCLHFCTLFRVCVCVCHIFIKRLPINFFASVPISSAFLWAP